MKKMCARRQSLYIIGTASCLLLNLNFLFQPKLVLFFQNLHLCLFVKSLICSLLCEKSFCLFLHWENHICAFLHSCALFWRNKSLGYLCSVRRSESYFHSSFTEMVIMFFCQKIKLSLMFFSSFTEKVLLVVCL